MRRLRGAGQSRREQIRRCLPAETLVMEEDAQPLEQPIIAPVVDKKFELVEREAPETAYSLDFLTGLMSNPGAHPRIPWRAWPRIPSTKQN